MIYKIAFPVLFSLLAFVGTVVGLFNIHSDLWFLAIFWPATFAWLLWFSARLKWVSVDDRLFYVAGLRTEIQIPFSEIERLEASFMWRPKQITLHLRSQSRFGKKIVFVPPQRSFESMRGGHPLVDELTAIIGARGEV